MEKEPRIRECVGCVAYLSDGGHVELDVAMMMFMLMLNDAAGIAS